MAEQLQRIIPMLAYEDGVKAITWLCDVFGFVEKTRWLSGLEYGGPGTRFRAEDLEGQRWMFMQTPK